MVLITEAKLRAMLPKGIPNPYLINKEDKLTPAAVDFLMGRGIAVEIPESRSVENQVALTIPVGVSNRHVHLSPEDLEKLFGSGYQLTPERDLSQPGQYAAKEAVTLLGPRGFIQGVKVLGPARGNTQVEISRTDGFKLGIHPPVRISGNIAGTPGAALIGPSGVVTLDKGVVVAKCHVHMAPDDARKFSVVEGDKLILQTIGERPIIFQDVVVRISSSYALDFHIDQDEANAANIKTGDAVQFVGKNGQLLSLSGR